MRSFGTKLQLPLILLLVVMTGIMELYWLPNWQAKVLEDRVAEEKQQLITLAQALSYPIAVGEEAHVAELLDSAFTRRHVWADVELEREDHSIAFEKHTSDNSASSVIRQQLEYDGQVVGQLIVNVDLNALVQTDVDRVRVLESILLIALLLTVVLVGVLQKLWIIRPISHLVDVARNISEGDFNSQLPKHTSSTALHELLGALTYMRGSIAEKHAALEQQIVERESAERRLIDSQHVAQIGCWEFDIQKSVFWWSDSLIPIMALPHDVMSCDAFYQGIHPADTARLKVAFERLRDEGEPLDEEFRVNGPTSMQFVHMVGRYDRDKARCFGTCQDVTDRKSIEASLRKLSSAITFSGSSVMIIDIVGTIEYVNPKYTESTGFRLEELLGQSPTFLSRDYMPDDKYDVLWQTVMSGANWRGELRSARKDGSLFWSLVSLSPIKNEFGEISHFVVVLEDVSELKEAHARMEQLALFDELTGLANRRQFHRRLDAVIASQSDVSSAAVMLLDLDFFKTINDTQGHQVGDELLKTVSVRLKRSIKESDVAARLGGDEFALLISPIHNENEVVKIAERILAALARPFRINDTELQITTSIGIAMIPRDGTEADTLLKHADLAMYQAKEMGRHQFRFFTETLHEKLQQYIRFTREMPLALENGEFKLFFQPQIDLTTGNVIGAEALIRWQHPELGLVPPYQFISVAEETGFIVPLGRWVVAAACQSLSAMRDAGWPDMRLSVNLSARQFRDPQLIEMVTQVVQESNIDPSHLEIEITETLVMHDVKKAITTLKSLQDLGITIAIDDFGIGYSSFSYLKTLPINVLKIDREFIKDIPDHTDDMEITSAIISMAHRLHLKVVAEGIETDAQRQFLESHACDFGQGFFFSKPVSEQVFIEFLGQYEKQLVPCVSVQQLLI